MEVDEDVGRGDHGAEDGVVHDLAKRAIRIPGKETVRVLAVDQADERRAQQERRHVDQGQGDDGPARRDGISFG